MWGRGLPRRGRMKGRPYYKAWTQGRANPAAGSLGTRLLHFLFPQQRSLLALLWWLGAASHAPRTTRHNSCAAPEYYHRRINRPRNTCETPPPRIRGWEPQATVERKDLRINSPLTNWGHSPLSQTHNYRVESASPFQHCTFCANNRVWATHRR